MLRSLRVMHRLRSESAVQSNADCVPLILAEFYGNPLYVRRLRQLFELLAQTVAPRLPQRFPIVVVFGDAFDFELEGVLAVRWAE